MSKTVVLTGITGFIAKRIALDLLEAGHSVRGSLRSLRRADEVRDALRPHLTDPAALDRLSFVELDLTSDTGWADAMQGADVLMHTASPFPMQQPKSEDDIVRPAVDGTLRALNGARAAGITRVVLTSSMVAMMHQPDAATRPVTEADWSKRGDPTLVPYGLSKTLAEKAAWDFVADHPEMTLITINPGLVAGTPMDAHYGTSLGLIERILSGKDPMLPDMRLPVVDIADVSRLHVQAVEDNAMDGTRNMAADSMWSMPDIGRALAAEYPDRKIATRPAPRFLLRILALFDATVKTTLPSLGVPLELDNSATRARTGIRFIPGLDAIKASAAFIAAHKNTAA